MASPQIQNGYLKIANELVKQFKKFRISGEEWQILWVVFSKTYGFNKKQDQISLTIFEYETGIKRSNIVRARDRLVSKKILGIKKETRDVTTYWIEKDYEKWTLLVSKKRLLNNDTRGSIIFDNQLVSKKRHTKDIKDNLKTIYSPSIIDFEQIWSKYPNKVGKKMAIKHFKASVKTKEDLENLQKAITNYLSSKRVSQGFVQNGSTFMNNWRDWIDYKEEVCKRCKDRGSYTSSTGYNIICECPAGQRKAVGKI